jgi:hypothetical protein
VPDDLVKAYTMKQCAIVYAFTDVSPIGQLLAPEEALPKYWNAVGFCVRDILDITI